MRLRRGLAIGLLLALAAATPAAAFTPYESYNYNAWGESVPMPSTYEVADTVYTYTYRMAFGSATDYSLSAASGLFQSVVGTVLLIGSNALSRKMTDSSLF